ncbi:MAG: hypothetical protein AAFS07_12460 [Pseudomonadota bacterium]
MAVAPDPIAVSDRFVALFTERAVPAVRHLRMFETWALDAPDPRDVADFIGEAEGAVRLYWDEAVILYQKRDEALCEVRAVPVDRDRVIRGFEHWAANTAPPLAPMPEPAEGMALDLFGPHPTGHMTHVLLSFANDPDDRAVWQAHASVAWMKEDA